MERAFFFFPESEPDDGEVHHGDPEEERGSFEEDREGVRQADGEQENRSDNERRDREDCARGGSGVGKTIEQIVWEVAGKIPIDPRPLTIRQLFAMYDGKLQFTTEFIGALFGSKKKKRDLDNGPSKMRDKQGNVDIAISGSAIGLGMPPHLRPKIDPEKPETKK